MGKWQVGDKLGYGATGVVHECTSSDFPGQRLAIKRLQADLVGSPELVERFRREVSIAQSLTHPSIMPVIEKGTTSNGVPYFVMIRGDRSLEKAIQDPFTRSESWAIDTFREILSGMAHAHERNVLHRDLKPDNIMLIGDQPLIVDFGSGKQLDVDGTTLTLTAQQLGTLRYIAPEQLADAKLAGPPADVYSLGKIFGYMLTGRQPLPSMPYDTSDVPSRFQWFVDKCCRLNASERFADARTALQELERVAAVAEIEPAPTIESLRLLVAAIVGQLGKPTVSAAIESLARQLRENHNDEELYRGVLDSMPESVISAWAETQPGSFRDVIQAYDVQVSHGLPFERCDTVARVLVTVFRATTEFGIRRLCLVRMFEMGYDHNRWFVRDATIDLLVSLASHADVSLAEEVILEHRSAAAWVAETALNRPMRSQLREAFKATTQDDQTPSYQAEIPF